MTVTEIESNRARPAPAAGGDRSLESFVLVDKFERANRQGNCQSPFNRTEFVDLDAYSFNSTKWCRILTSPDVVASPG
jgi:hypothetical protein